MVMVNNEKKKSGILTILFLLSILGVLLALLFHVYFKPETLGLGLKKYGMISNKNFNSESKDLEKINLYFSDNRCEFLKLEERDIQKSETVEEKAMLILNELVSGPKNQEHFLTIPDSTKINSIYLFNQTLVVDFSKDIIQKMAGGISQEIMAIYSIVNSLCDIPEVKNVQILISNHPVNTLLGHINLRQPVNPDMKLVK